MKREIKFRGFSSDSNKWIYGYLNRPFDDVTQIIEKIPSNASQMSLIVNGSEGQFTGFLDKNGKEIYDGDLVKDGSIKYPYLKEVYWDDRFQWSLRLINNGNQFAGSLSGDKYIVPKEMKIEVIGNIHENSELLDD